MIGKSSTAWIGTPALALALIMGVWGCKGPSSETTAGTPPSDGQRMQQKLQGVEEKLKGMEQTLQQLQTEISRFSAEEVQRKAGHALVIKHVHTDVKTACRKCHHKGLKVTYCSGCHKSPEQKKAIYHKVCGTCHKDHNVKTTCNTCHQKNMGVPGVPAQGRPKGATTPDTEKDGLFVHGDKVKPTRKKPVTPGR